MDWLKSAVEATPGLASLPTVPKVIISLLIIGAAGLVLVLMWTPPPDPAIVSIVSQCYRRALFTRTHAQMSLPAMFISIGKCREAVQQQVTNIRRDDLQQTAADLLGILDQMERRNPIVGPEDMVALDELKVSALRKFEKLAAASGKHFKIPGAGMLGEGGPHYDQKSLDAPPTSEEIQNQHAVRAL